MKVDEFTDDQMMDKEDEDGQSYYVLDGDLIRVADQWWRMMRR